MKKLQKIEVKHYDSYNDKYITNSYYVLGFKASKNNGKFSFSNFAVNETDEEYITKEINTNQDTNFDYLTAFCEKTIFDIDTKTCHLFNKLLNQLPNYHFDIKLDEIYKEIDIYFSFVDTISPKQFKTYKDAYTAGQPTEAIYDYKGHVFMKSLKYDKTNIDTVISEEIKKISTSVIDKIKQSIADNKERIKKEANEIKKMEEKVEKIEDELCL